MSGGRQGELGQVIRRGYVVYTAEGPALTSAGIAAALRYRDLLAGQPLAKPVPQGREALGSQWETAGATTNSPAAPLSLSAGLGGARQELLQAGSSGKGNLGEGDSPGEPPGGGGAYAPRLRLAASVRHGCCDDSDC